MAALNFPNSPAIGDTWPSPPQAGLPTYQWDGTSWFSNFALGFAYVPLDGSQPMTGLLTLSGDPVNPLQASTKQYADAGLTGKAVRYDAVQTLTDAQQLQARQNINALIRSYLAGLGLSTPGASTSFTVAVGMAMDGANVAMMVLAAALTKTTAAWTLGAGGALDTGAIANSTWYHVYLIRRPDTGVVDVCLSLSATAPTIGGAIPAAYTQFRRIGALLTNASPQWVPFNQFGDYFMWATEAVDQSGIASANSSWNVALSVPRGLNIRALINIRVSYNTAPGTMTFSSLLVPGSQGTATVLATATAVYAQLELMTDTSAQIRVTGNAVGQLYYINTYGWIDTRGKDA
jgi:hypothetical protein